LAASNEFSKFSVVYKNPTLSDIKFKSYREEKKGNLKIEKIFVFSIFKE
jgi:hypothetical protein